MTVRVLHSPALPSPGVIDENQVVCTEDLAVKNMVKNRRLARSISDAGWSEFVRQLKYKASWYGREFIKVDRFFPSSKTCSTCGHKVDIMPLKIRLWECPMCGQTHDRDENAANNILAEGLSVLACGETIRPGQSTGTSQRNRKAIGVSL